MRKRFVTTLLIGMLSVACIFGFTACGENDEVKVPKGQAVTEAEWKAAIEATAKAENYTYEGVQTSSTTEKYEDENGNEVTESYNSTITIKEYLGNTSYYNEMITTYTGDENGESKMATYYVIEGKTLWRCRYEEESGDSEEEQEKPDWSASGMEIPEGGKIYDYAGDYIGYLRYEFQGEFYTSADGEAVAFADLYSAFTYKDGKYTADLFNDHKEPITLSISFKDGYVAGYEMFYVYEETSVKAEIVTTVVIKNYGSTTVPAAPAGATEAINKVKADK